MLGLRFATGTTGGPNEVRVRLIKKLAQWIDGVDLRTHAPGDVFDLSRSEARLLLAEGWAVAARDTERRRSRHMSGATHRSALAADRS